MRLARAARTARPGRAGLPLLTPGQTDAVRHPYTVVGPRPGPRPTSEEHGLAEALAEDGRAGLKQLADRTGTSTATVRQRLHQLRADDIHRLLTERLPHLPGYRHARVHLVTAFVKENGRTPEAVPSTAGPSGVRSHRPPPDGATLRNGAAPETRPLNSHDPPPPPPAAGENPGRTKALWGATGGESAA
ncbi:AsnC family protein [Streptomyces sp. NBC_01268]|uniref:AsnC family protein n=1 Tax=Streptomyces sp. NBC_01268 TaxID=2903806 RepID=UPI002E31FC1C|nr:Lrp/AsnC family transcriptional regulator [Streptomyces sp. NBC_01268]